MKIVVVGGGGREHAIVKAIKKNPKVKEIYALPGNGGMAGDAVCVPVGARDIEGVVSFAVQNKVDFAVVAPDDPLVLGLVDRLHEKGIKCFGPESKAAIIEGSKIFAKNLMKKYGIPTADFKIFDNYDRAVDYLKGVEGPVVVKADGLALGKGVVVAKDADEAIKAVDSMMNGRIFGDSGARVVIEKFLTGPEVSVLAFTDGKTVLPMVSSMDHKRAGNGDTGPNTGGMGCVAPNPYYTPEVAERCMKEIFIPTIKAMNSEGRTFKGCLYFGLMLTESGPKVIEYNSRFGDPETQTVLPLMESDLLEVMLAVEEERLGDIDLKFSDKCSCCVVLASQGYPLKYSTGYSVSDSGVSGQVFYAGVKLEGGKLLTSGGRVAGVTSVADTVEDAVAAAYKDAEKITFQNKYFRDDIGAKCLIKQ